MNPKHESRALHLVYSRDEHRIEASRFCSAEAGPQGSLFPNPKPGVVVFAHLAALGGDEFVSLMRLAKPSFVFDLRMAPRFDLGRLDRRTAFNVFDEVNATYFDAATPLMMGQQRERTIEGIREAISKTHFARPLLFLFGSVTGTILSDEEVLGILISVGKPAADLVVVPATMACVPNTVAPV